MRVVRNRSEKGKDIGVISKLLGHANPTITQNIYVHWRDEQIHQASLEVEVCGKMLHKMQNLESDPDSSHLLPLTNWKGMPRDGVEPPTPAFSGPRSTS